MPSPYDIPDPDTGLGHLAHTQAVVDAVNDLDDRATALENTNSVFFEGSCGTGATVAATGFNTYPIDTVITNDGGGSYNTSNYIFTVPEDGLYDCQATIRIEDSSTARSLGVGIGTTNADGAHFFWGQMGGINRDAKQYRRVTRFTTGDLVRLYIYSDGYVFNVNAGNLAIRKVAN